MDKSMISINVLLALCMIYFIQDNVKKGKKKRAGVYGFALVLISIVTIAEILG